MYLHGFGSHHESEAIEGTLPLRQNSPQKCAYGIYAEQINGSAFTRPRHTNLNSWLYRLIPSVVQHDYKPYKHNIDFKFAKLLAPNPLRWDQRPKTSKNLDFIDGLELLAGNNSLNTYLYHCNKSMSTRYFSNSDGEMLFVPYDGTISLHTEFGLLEISPGMIAVIPRGIKFKVVLQNHFAAGYICENKGTPLILPELGPLGANSLANPRHFQYPVAAFEENQKNITLICKSQDHWWVAKAYDSPLNVVAWHGNYAPYSYDLSLFNTINTVSFDHPDPSIFTVLTSPSDTKGVPNFDFVIFPSRWMVAEHTFRPPYFHRNIMSELMGLIKGKYDAKEEGFSIGGVSIHNCMVAHGPDTETYLRETNSQLNPIHYDDTLAFMFESREVWQVTESYLKDPTRQKKYTESWQGLKQERS